MRLGIRNMMSTGANGKNPRQWRMAIHAVSMLLRRLAVLFSRPYLPKVPPAITSRIICRPHRLSAFVSVNGKLSRGNPVDHQCADSPEATIITHLPEAGGK